MINAIETRYAGCHFRSRLEARWAVFFDALGVEWQYEPEGVRATSMINGDADIHYLPDFYLPQSRMWIEVKGSLNVVDWRKLTYALDFDRWPESLPQVDGLLLLGNPPRPTLGYVPTFPMMEFYKGGRCLGPAVFTPTGVRTQGELLAGDVAVLRHSPEEKWRLAAWHYVQDNRLYGEIWEDWWSPQDRETWVEVVRSVWLERCGWWKHLGWTRVDAALTAARSHRFST